MTPDFIHFCWEFIAVFLGVFLGTKFGKFDG